MRILFLTPNLPHPPRTGSGIIAHHHIEELSRRHEVHLLCYRTRDSDELGRLASWCRSIELVNRLPKRTLVIQRAVGALRGQPLQVAHTYSRAMAEAVRRREGEGFDATIVHLQEMAQFATGHPRPPRIWMLEDPPALKVRRTAESASWPRRRWADLEVTAMSRYERAHLDRFDCVTLLNRRDAEDYAAYLPAARLDWVPYGVAPETERPLPFEQRTAGMIVISGNMFHPPNVAAVDRFCRDVFPLVRSSCQSATLWLVGARPAATIRAWGRLPGITVTGEVPSVREYLRRASVSVCTVSLRIGTQTKVLEALACGTPVVTTSAGNHGVEGVPGEHLYVEDAAEAIALRVTSLLRGEQWARLSHAGHALVQTRFTWAHSGAKLETILDSLTRPEP
jgi:glycosyltransferase involved in cell wall biosynthesis